MESTIGTMNEAEVTGTSPWWIALREELAVAGEPLCERTADGMTFEIRRSARALWIMGRWPSGGGVACCAAYTPAGEAEIVKIEDDGGKIDCRIATPIGHYQTVIELPESGHGHLRWTTKLTTSAPLTTPYWPRDLFPIDQANDPLETRGVVHAKQQGPEGGFLYLSLTRPASGSLLYMQNLTALNGYFDITHTSPANRVSGAWPELGFSLPPSESATIAADKELTVADAFIAFTPELPVDKPGAGKLFLDLYADIYLALDRPDTVYRHWPRRVFETMRDLTHSPECSVRIDDRRYMTAYVGSKDRPPESMVQLAVLLPMLEYRDWHADDIPLADALLESIPTFYDEQLRTVVRWLPQKRYAKSNEMDSWYLYHTYHNIARLAKRGDERGWKLLFDSIEYGIHVAQHFEYRWPVFYDPKTLEALRWEAAEGVRGEHDVAGLYAHLMIRIWELTREQRYLDEAEHAAQTLAGYGFGLAYQLNNTAFAAKGTLELWRITGREEYRELSYLCIANIVQHFWLWDCDYGHGKFYRTFMGLPPLHNGPYLALYEELETMAALHDYLRIGGSDLPGSIRLLASEYCAYLLDRAWYHYPGEIPADALATEVESGHLNRSISVPLEDLYDGWKPAGKVGQEVYGAAAPFVFATRHYHKLPIDGVLLYATYPITPPERKRGGGRGRIVITFDILGDARGTCGLRIIADDLAPLPIVRARIGKGKAARALAGALTEEGHCEFIVPGNCRVELTLEPAPATARNGHTLDTQNSPPDRKKGTDTSKGSPSGRITSRRRK